MPARGSTEEAGFSHLVIHVLSRPSYEVAFHVGLQPQLGLEKLDQRCDSSLKDCELISSLRTFCSWSRKKRLPRLSNLG